MAERAIKSIAREIGELLFHIIALGFVFHKPKPAKELEPTECR